jgi:uncharacterized membrane protein
MQRFNPAPHHQQILSQQRLTVLDALRGFAMVWMTLYHLCFDLNHFGWIHQDFYNNPVWTWQRSAIVSLFLFCVGWSQAATSVRWGGFAWRRWLQIAVCAALVSASSYVMYPQSFIYFGVLHAVCVMLLLLWGLCCVLARVDLMFGLKWQSRVLTVIGVVCMVLFAYPPVIANETPWNILGLISQKPITEDYVPLLPWFALVCWGYAFGLWQQGRPKNKGLNFTLNPLICNSLATLGQYSLPYYMLHQPVLIGLLYLLNLGRFT